MLHANLKLDKFSIKEYHLSKQLTALCLEFQHHKINFSTYKKTIKNMTIL